MELDHSWKIVCNRLICDLSCVNKSFTFRLLTLKKLFIINNTGIREFFGISWVYKIKVEITEEGKGREERKNGVSRDRSELCDGISPERWIPGERLSSSSNFQASRLHPCRCFHHRQAPSGNQSISSIYNNLSIS